MLRSLKDLENYEIGATDGHIGHVKDFYFDDHDWVVRYLIVDTGPWLFGREVLISPVSIAHPNWAEQSLPVSITRAQVEASPSIDTDKPVSRQYETEYLDHYGYPFYWSGSGIWGGGMYPYGMTAADDDPHLHSCKEVVGYRIHAVNGEIGHVESLLVDEETWAVRYLVVNTSNWWQGQKVLIAPAWISGVRWFDESVTVDLSREAIKGAPVFESTAELNRKRETALYRHHGLPGYWTDARLLEAEMRA
jgi:sporulation protein YlmC with PRC-barrel domain